MIHRGPRMPGSRAQRRQDAHLFKADILPTICIDVSFWFNYKISVFFKYNKIIIKVNKVTNSSNHSNHASSLFFFTFIKKRSTVATFNFVSCSVHHIQIPKINQHRWVNTMQSKTKTNSYSAFLPFLGFWAFACSFSRCFWKRRWEEKVSE